MIEETFLEFRYDVGAGQVDSIVSAWHDGGMHVF